MRRIDELHLAHPFMGARMLRDQLDREGIHVGRRHIRTRMLRMGIEALAQKIYPLPARQAGHHPSQPGLGAGHRLHPRWSGALCTSAPWWT